MISELLAVSNLEKGICFDKSEEERCGIMLLFSRDILLSNRREKFIGCAITLREFQNVR